MMFEGNGAEEDDVIAANVEQVKARIATLIERNRRRRKGEPEQIGAGS